MAKSADVLGTMPEKASILITTSKFSVEALEYVNNIDRRIVLIDGEHLANLMIDCNIGVSEVARYTIKKIDLDCCEDGQ